MSGGADTHHAGNLPENVLRALWTYKFVCTCVCACVCAFLRVCVCMCV
jgi:hypothetical protein